MSKFRRYAEDLIDADDDLAIEEQIAEARRRRARRRRAEELIDADDELIDADDEVVDADDEPITARKRRANVKKAKIAVAGKISRIARQLKSRRSLTANQKRALSANLIKLAEVLEVIEDEEQALG